jgi:hypothetical protein
MVIINTTTMKAVRKKKERDGESKITLNLVII